MKAIVSVVGASAVLIAPAICSATTMYTVTNLGTLGGGGTTFTETGPAGINSSGQVTGDSYLSGNAAYHAFLFDGTIHDLGTLPGYLDSIGNAINDGGQVVGYVDPNGQHTAAAERAFLYDGTMHDIGTLGGTGAAAYGMNNIGQVTGGAYTSGNALFRPFIYQNGAMHDLGIPASLIGSGTAINAKGQVAGTAGSHAFLYDGTYHDLGTLGGNESDAWGINNSGVVVGQSVVAGTSPWHAFLYDGMIHDLGTLGGSNSFAYGINSLGQVVGAANTLTSQHAFIYDAVHGMVDLNSFISPSSGWTLQSASKINDSGQIVGDGLFDGVPNAFLLTPAVPEPSTLALMLMAAAVVALLCLKRRGTP